MKRLLALSLVFAAACGVEQATAPDLAKARSVADSVAIVKPTLSFDRATVDVSRSADSRRIMYDAPKLIVRRGTALAADTVSLSFAPTSNLTCADRGGVFANESATKLVRFDSATVDFPLSICPTISGTFYQPLTATIRASVILGSDTLTASATVRIR